MEPFPLSSAAGRWKLLLGLALFLTLLALVDLRRLGASLAGADEPLLGASLAAACGAVVVLEARRFQTAFAVWGLSYAAALRITLASLFVGSFTPGAVGAEIYKLYALQRRERGMVRPFVRLALMRIIGALSVLATAACAWLSAPERFRDLAGQVAWHPQHWLQEWTPALWIAGAVLAVLGVAALAVGWRRLALRVRQGWEALAGVRLRQVGELFGLSVGIALLRGLSLVLLVRSLGERARFADLLVVLAFSVLASVLPISPAGLGVQEGVLAGCLVLLRIPPPAAVAVAVLNRGFLWLFAAGGGWVLAVARPATPPGGE
jgi:uncharacterized membrane protein YbhN (UPF0104 family)